MILLQISWSKLLRFPIKDFKGEEVLEVLDRIFQIQGLEPVEEVPINWDDKNPYQKEACYHMTDKIKRKKWY